ncbi:MAG: glycosyltransferase [Planctomycetes bacterium]|nr:glycosyltransferase [Planctomycetota bacterium]
MKKHSLLITDKNGKPGRYTIESPVDDETFNKLIGLAHPSKQSPIYVCHYIPVSIKGLDFYRLFRQLKPVMKYYVGYTTFETDSIPNTWVDSCNQMDEIWVPSTFNQKTFCKAGVDPEKIFVIPHGVNPSLFNLDRVSPIIYGKPAGFTFLSIFEFTYRKGWDVLIRAYLEEFTPDEDVRLIVKTHRGAAVLQEEKGSVKDILFNYISSIGFDPENTPPIIIVEEPIPLEQMPSFYRMANAFILPTRGEGWGIPLAEAMLMGLPTIATRWGGQLDFMNDDNSYLIDVKGLVPVSQEQIKDNPFYTGHNWAEPSVKHTRQLMRFVFENRKNAIKTGDKAREDILNNWTHIHAAKKISKRISEIEKKFPIARKSDSIVRTKRDLAVIWNGVIFDESGYADEARNLITNLDSLGVTIKISQIGLASPHFITKMNSTTRETLFRFMFEKIPDKFISIVQIPAHSFFINPNAKRNIGRTLFESDRLPPLWVKNCNVMDEVWVASDFNIQTFAKSGVELSKLYKIPEGIDLEFYNPNVAPLKLPERRGFNFLSIFAWQYRKGWDILLRAYIEEFDKSEDVCLTLRAYPFDPRQKAQAENIINTKIKDFVTRVMHRNIKDIPSISLLSDIVPIEQMPQLYKAADAFVLPSRGEGWGRPYMEAMAMELPTIGTRWSGNLEFMNDANSFLIDIEGLVEAPPDTDVDYFAGHKFAEPSVKHLQRLMRYVFENRKVAKQKAQKARAFFAENYTWQKVAQMIVDRLTEENPSYTVKPLDVTPSCTTRTFRVAWEGSQFVNHSLALINRELTIALTKSQKCDLNLAPYEAHQFGKEADPERFSIIEERLNKVPSKPVEFHVRHQYPPNFNPPESGYWINIQPWEFGSLLKTWIKPMQNLMDELWVPSNHVRRCYIDSGINPEKVFVIPNGVNTNAFNPKVQPMKLNAKKSFKFLFVGGTIWRKGIDILLESYVRSFTSNDDVCLVIKDMGRDSFYKGQDASKIISAIQATPNAPEILYLTEDIPVGKIAGLYTACDCLVHPYRGEGFGLPVAEAMACGLPVIVTKGGATDDFCTSETAYQIHAKVIYFSKKEFVGQGWVLDPDRIALSEQMKYVFENRDEARLKGLKASKYIKESLTWEKAADMIIERFAALPSKPILRHSEKPAEIPNKRVVLSHA